jgi:hypothetical protein
MKHGAASVFNLCVSVAPVCIFVCLVYFVVFLPARAPCATPTTFEGANEMIESSAEKPLPTSPCDDVLSAQQRHQNAKALRKMPPNSESVSIHRLSPFYPFLSWSYPISIPFLSYSYLISILFLPPHAVKHMPFSATNESRSQKKSAISATRSRRWATANASAPSIYFSVPSFFC